MVVEMKPTLLSLIGSHLFAGMDHEDPYAYLSTFMELCSKAKTWLQSHPNKTCNTWEEVEETFTTRFLPPSRFISAKLGLINLYETWERFKSLLQRCPNHSFDDVAQLHIFYSGLRPQTKMIFDASAGSTMMSKSSEE
ncbi:hypothetical protein GmHk_16G046532 [Glycine max]|nr:hypothetical protein GmHk_16G046532 [Glycine max]